MSFRKQATNPGVNDDVDKGYDEGSVVMNTTDSSIWMCTSNADGAAVWEQIDSTGFVGDVSKTSATGGGWGIKTLTESHTLAAATTSATTIQVPQNVLLLACPIRVTTTITQDAAETTFRYGLTAGGTPFNDFETAVLLASGTTALGLRTIAYHTAAADTITFELDGAAAFTAGVVRIDIHYMDFTAPTS